MGRSNAKLLKRTSSISGRQPKNNLMLSRNFFLLAMVACLLASCAKDDLAFDIIESPVLAEFESLNDAGPDMLKIKATFLDLDKSGILDHNIGIDSIPVAGLSVKVFVYESDLVEELMTDSEGSVIFESAISELNGAGRLEWVGTYEDTPFRIYQNF
jgi:hypothetical protein